MTEAKQPVPERIALSRQCDNYAHTKCAYPDRCTCDCHVKDREWNQFREWFNYNDGRPMYDTEGCKVYVRRAFEAALKYTRATQSPEPPMQTVDSTLSACNGVSGHRLSSLPR